MKTWGSQIPYTEVAFVLGHKHTIHNEKHKNKQKKKEKKKSKNKKKKKHKS